MARETTTATTRTIPLTEIELRPLEWWAEAGLIEADLEHDPRRDTIPGAGIEIDTSRQARRIPPVPAFVRLSRLIDPEQIRAARGVDAIVDPDPDPDPIDSNSPPVPLSTDPAPAPTRSWADSAGRPLFQIGLAAIVAATVVAVTTFGPTRGDLSTVESPAVATVLDPESGGPGSPLPLSLPERHRDR